MDSKEPSGVFNGDHEVQILARVYGEAQADRLANRLAQEAGLPEMGVVYLEVETIPLKTAPREPQ